MTTVVLPPSGLHTRQRRFRFGDHERPSRARRFAPDICAAAVLAAAVVFHAAVLVSRGSPTGVDFGNWLYFGHQILGDPVTGSAPTTYPPLIPVTSALATSLLGPLWANASVMSLAGAAPATGVYLASRMSGVRWAAVPGTALLAVTASTGEPVAWGGAPQLVGLGFAALALGFATRLAHRRRLGTAVGLSICVFGVAVSSHLILAQFALAFAVLVVLVLIVDRPELSRATWSGRHGWLACGAVVVVPLVVLVPSYARLLTTAGGTLDAKGTPRGWPTFRVFLENLWAVYREAPWIWKGLVILAALTPLVTIRARQHNPLWLVTTALVVATLIQAVASTEERLVYFTPTAVVFALILCTEVLTRSVPHTAWQRTTRFGLIVTLVVVTVYPAYRGVMLFPQQTDFYGKFMPAGTIEGLDWIRANTDRDELMLAAPIDGAPFGWWVQGYAQRPTLVASRDRWLNFPSERARAQEAVGLLSTPEPLGSETLAAARKAGVDYLVLPWAWGGLKRPQLEAFRAGSSALVRFDNDALVVIEVPR